MVIGPAGAKELAALGSTTPTADTCYIAIFDGTCAEGKGGVYKISPAWCVYLQRATPVSSRASESQKKEM